MMTPRGLSERLYAALLRLLPGDVACWRDDALATFRDLRNDAAQRGRLAYLRTLAHVFLAAAAAAPRAWASRPQRTAAPARRTWLAVGGLADDTRLAIRALVHRPGFALAVTLVLAIGIGAATSIYSVVDCVLLRPLPYPAADRLVFFDEGAHPGPLFELWREQTAAFDQLAAATDANRDLTGDGPPVALHAVSVSRELLGMFGARPQIGRLLDADDFTRKTRAVVLAAGLFERRFGGDPAIVGRSLVLDGEPWQVVGVMAEDFVPPEILVGREVDAYLPLDFDAESLSAWHTWTLSVAGRLRPGTGLEAAQAEIDSFAHQAAEAHPGSRRRRDGSVRLTPLVPLREATVGDVERALHLLLAAVGLILAVASVNVAGLFLARGSERGREMSLRLALGARPGRVARQTMIESVLLSLVGGSLGCGLAFALTRALPALVPGGLPRLGEVTVDLRILLLAALVTLVTGVLFGLAPAWQASRARVQAALSGGMSSHGANRATHRARGLLVVAEVAMALVLLSGAGLLGHSLLRLMQVELGFDPGGLSRLELRLGDGYDEASRYDMARRLLARVEAVPGVESAALGWTVPFDYVGDSRCCWRSGFSTGDDREPLTSMVHPISPGYFHTLGARLLAGRELGWHDGEGALLPVVINHTAATQLFGDRPAVGATLTMSDQSLAVVGVVEDVKRWGAASEPEPAVYLSYFRHGGELEDLRLIARSASAAGSSVAAAMRDIVWDLDPGLPIADIVTLEQRVSRSLAVPRFYSLLLAGFAGLGLLLAAVGLCGALLLSVNQRRRELGIRLAVGARGNDLLRLVLGRGLRLAGCGLVLGLIGSLAMSRLLGGLVYGITATDPATYVAVSLLLLAVAFAASYLPARRAARTDPIATLRAE